MFFALRLSSFPLLILLVVTFATCAVAQSPSSGATPLVITPVPTAIPAFIGYTETAEENQPDDLRRAPRRIRSMAEFERFFGGPPRETGLTLRIDETLDGAAQTTALDIRAQFEGERAPYWMYHSLQAFFANGGGDCYVVSVGGYGPDGIDRAKLTGGLAAAERIDEVTLLVFPDAPGLPSAADHASVQQQALAQCGRLGDRFAIMEVWLNPDTATSTDDVAVFRTSLGTNHLSYGAAYYPYLETTQDYVYREEDVKVFHQINGEAGGPLAGTLAGLAVQNPVYYQQAKTALGQLPVVLSPASIMAGIYARTDRDRGVWKAPANITPNGVIKPTRSVNDALQQNLTVDPAGGKSINAIRMFTGRGILVWGARTLAGNDNKWRYIPVRRHAMMLKESVQEGTAFAASETNDAITWQSVKSLVENFLIQQWRAGALPVVKPKQAFFIKVGLGETMTVRDLKEGRMIIELGFAPLKPAEFVILQIVQPMGAP